MSLHGFAKAGKQGLSPVARRVHSSTNRIVKGGVMGQTTLKRRVMKLLNRYDPMGVQPAHIAPYDEYVLEAQCITQQLSDTGVVTVADLRNIGVRSFGDPDWLDGHASELKDDINALM